MIEFFYYIAIAMPATLSAIGCGIGQGVIGKKALKAIHIQPEAASQISKVCIIGIALTETTAIFGLVTSLLLLLNTTPLNPAYEAVLCLFGIAFAVGISGLVSGIVSSSPAGAACLAIARQPFMHNKILNLMLITQTLIMTPNIFGFLIALLIKNKLTSEITLPVALQLFSSGISIGFGSIGPAIGLSLFAYSACHAVGINKKSFGKILTFTFIGEAIIETPLIFAFIVALSILTTNMVNASVMKGIALLAAAICIALSTLAPGFASGKTGATTCDQIAENIDQYSVLSKTTLLALAMIDTCAIYGLLTSMMLVFFVNI